MCHNQQIQFLLRMSFLWWEISSGRWLPVYVVDLIWLHSHHYLNVTKRSIGKPDVPQILAHSRQNQFLLENLLFDGNVPQAWRWLPFIRSCEAHFKVSDCLRPVCGVSLKRQKRKNCIEALFSHTVNSDKELSSGYIQFMLMLHPPSIWQMCRPQMFSLISLSSDKEWKSCNGN